jgi:hypothetical protein
METSTHSCTGRTFLLVVTNRTFCCCLPQVETDEYINDAMESYDIDDDYS